MKPSSSEKLVQNIGRPAVHLHRLRVAEAREMGADVVDLGYADIRREPPPDVLTALERRITSQGTLNYYGDVPGLRDLRQALANDLSNVDNRINAGNIVITAGANHGVVLALLATTGPGDAVALPAPFFFNHITQIQLLGRSPHTMVTSADDHYALPAVAWDRAFKKREVRAVLLTQPRNPTSTQMSDNDLTALAVETTAKARPLILDESYREFGYIRSKFSWSPEYNVIRVGSLSKSFCLAGWRIGYVVVPDRWRDDVIRAQDALMIHPTIASQQVALAALEVRQRSDFVTTLATEMANLRERARDRLLSCPWVDEVFADAGTFVWVVLKNGYISDTIAERLLEECAVGVLSGRAFGSPLEECLRVGVGCVSSERLDEGLNRLMQWRP